MRNTNNEHEVAIDLLNKILAEEFAVKGYRPKFGEIKGMIPDLRFNKNQKSIVIEVGGTDAQKILDYQKLDFIEEIRWYSKSCILVGKWKKIDKRWVQITISIEEQIDTFRKLELQVLEKQYQIQKITRNLDKQLREIKDRLNK